MTLGFQSWCRVARAAQRVPHSPRRRSKLLRRVSTFTCKPPASLAEAAGGAPMRDSEAAHLISSSTVFPPKDRCGCGRRIVIAGAD